MRKIERPISKKEVSIMIHLAEFQLQQASEILIQVMCGADKAVSQSMYEAAQKAYDSTHQALDVLKGKTDGK